MVSPARGLVAAFLLTLTVFAGCVTPPDSATPAATIGPLALDGALPIKIENVMTFTKSVVTPAVAISSDLYEPTMEVSDTGTIYVAGHVIAAATTGTPAWYSNDHGKTWAQLPFAGPLSSPLPTGAQPPPGDEGFIVAGEKGQAWMADIYAAGFSITGWCDNGKSQCYDNRQAYDRAATITGCNPKIVQQSPVPLPTSLNDRPWAAYGNKTLLVVNNAGGGPMQLGVMKVPPAAPVGIGGVNGPTWNLCASKGDDIPGVPAMRPDGLFAVPQMKGTKQNQTLTVVIGNAADIKKVEQIDVFHVTNLGAGTSNGGRTAFDKDGVLYVGAKNNSMDQPAKPATCALPAGLACSGGAPATIKDGRFIIAASTDGGKTFTNKTFSVGTAVQSFYLDGNMNGPGALASWSQVGTDKTKADWYVAHVTLAADGTPQLSNVTLALDEGPQFAAHVMGAALGPDGKAYFVIFDQKQATPGGTPIAVMVQKDGATLPVDVAAS